MDGSYQLNAIRDYAHSIFSDDCTGHDFFHMKRVAQMARNIALEEGADVFICEAAAWIHDIGDAKLFSNRNKVLNHLTDFLQSIDISDAEYKQIRHTADDVSFQKGKTPDTLEGKIVQDADRLDAIGAVGIARTFAYGGSQGQLIWNTSNQTDTSLQHFYDKLLKLKSLMNTESAKRIAIERHQFMEVYLEQFFREWGR
ncbi:HD domain-containing protein [Virgibacillus siamensis]|uniref:HD domain-containing protein n=1 Tax=Virgibacillus siamensis TaxID=480071 RepID=UPI0009875464|nr:HD domain-containing protein [Virgibacillus siamensis]